MPGFGSAYLTKMRHNKNTDRGGGVIHHDAWGYLSAGLSPWEAGRGCGWVGVGGEGATA